MSSFVLYRHHRRCRPRRPPQRAGSGSCEIVSGILNLARQRQLWKKGYIYVTYMIDLLSVFNNTCVALTRSITVHIVHTRPIRLRGGLNWTAAFD